MRVVNKFPMLLLRSPLYDLMSKSVLLLTFTGYKSGKKYTTLVTYLREDDEVLMTTASPWWKNLRGESGASVMRPGEVFQYPRSSCMVEGYNGDPRGREGGSACGSCDTG